MFWLLILHFGILWTPGSRNNSSCLTVAPPSGLSKYKKEEIGFKISFITFPKVNLPYLHQRMMLGASKNRLQAICLYFLKEVTF